MLSLDLLERTTAPLDRIHLLLFLLRRLGLLLVLLLLLLIVEGGALVVEPIPTRSVGCDRTKPVSILRELGTQLVHLDGYLGHLDVVEQLLVRERFDRVEPVGGGMHERVTTTRALGQLDLLKHLKLHRRWQPLHHLPIKLGRTRHEQLAVGEPLQTERVVQVMAQLLSRTLNAPLQRRPIDQLERRVPVDCARARADSAHQHRGAGTTTSATRRLPRAHRVGNALVRLVLELGKQFFSHAADVLESNWAQVPAAVHARHHDGYVGPSQPRETAHESIAPAGLAIVLVGLLDFARLPDAKRSHVVVGTGCRSLSSHQDHRGAGRLG